MAADLNISLAGKVGVNLPATALDMVHPKLTNKTFAYSATKGLMLLDSSFKGAARGGWGLGGGLGGVGLGWCSHAVHPAAVPSVPPTDTPHPDHHHPGHHQPPGLGYRVNDKLVGETYPGAAEGADHWGDVLDGKAAPPPEFAPLYACIAEIMAAGQQ